ncbi:MAG: peptide ligase PGM1-related protein [Oculatellaceae cyanobacterium bins.114]|nr:peptide ligase PGM1-related protein [Oculatellaceae cyanobacterium bins.114]
MQSLTLPLMQAEQFRQLQNQLRDRWQSIDEFDTGEYDVLVIPSLSLDQRELHKVTGIHHYEERLLFSLIRLRNPNTRVIYVTSQPIHPSVVDYYLQLLPGVPISHARNRLLLLCTYDSSLKPLTQKILERPRLMARIQQVLRQDSAYITCFNSTHLERDLSLQLGIPLLALDPDLLYWGTKSGSREIFQDSETPHPDGSELVQNAADLAAVAADLWERQPTLQRMVIKLNEGFSGQGNALLDLRSLQSVAPGHASTANRTEALHQHFCNLSFQSRTETWDNFNSKIPELGAIAEAFLEGDEKRSPSVQCRITPHGKVEILSTHDQILGGPDGQIFLGCRFPADEAYRMRLQEYGYRVGKVLADKGALERFSVDFLARPDADAEGGWELQAIEINLRKGGTTHPFMALKLLTQGYYDLDTGLFYSQKGNPKYYVATDNLQSDRYIGLLPDDLMDIVAHHRLHFNSVSETGNAFHLIGCLSEFGKLGLTSIGNSPLQAEELYNQVVQVLDDETHTPVASLVAATPPLTWSHG